MRFVECLVPSFYILLYDKRIELDNGETEIVEETASEMLADIERSEKIYCQTVPIGNEFFSFFTSKFESKHS